MDDWSRFLDAFFNSGLIERYCPDILKGVVVTIEIAAAVVVSGLVLGLALAILRSWRVLPLNALIVVFVDVFRALPPLVRHPARLFRAARMSGSTCRPSRCCGWCCRWCSRRLPRRSFGPASLSVPKGQWEAARSTGLGLLGTLTYVVLPQALRLSVPPLTNRTIAITKNTALGTVIGVGGDSQSGNHRAIVLRQRHAAHDGRDRLRDPVHPGRRARTLPRDAVRLAEGLMEAITQQFLNFAIMRTGAAARCSWV